MTEFIPVSTYADLCTLDEDEIIEGYHDGRAGEPEPGNNRSRAYWHGWRNGMIDSGRMPVDAAGMQLAKEFLQAQRRRA